MGWLAASTRLLTLYLSVHKQQSTALIMGKPRAGRKTPCEPHPQAHDTNTDEQGKRACDTGTRLQTGAAQTIHTRPSRATKQHPMAFPVGPVTGVPALLCVLSAAQMCSKQRVCRHTASFS